MSVEADPAVALTRELVAIRSINPGGSEAECAHHLGDLLARAGFEIGYHDFAPGRTSVHAARGGRAGTRRLCFAGHIDTVPLGDADWSVDPFAGELHDGKLYGRGVSDMKAGIAAFVTAAVALADRLDDGPGLLLIMAAGEETGCEGSRPLGGELAARFPVGAMVVAEPTYNLPKVGHRGAFWLRMVSTGKTAHGSMPELGVNALYKASRAIAKLEDFDFNVARHPHLGGNSLSVGNLHAGRNVNSVPDRAVMEVDVRTVPGVDHVRVREGFAQYLGEDVQSIEPFVDLDSVWTDPDDPFVQRVFDLTTPFLGHRPEVAALPFFTDAAVLKPAFGEVPTVILGPGDTHMAHQTDEFCVADRIPVAVAMYRALIEDWYRVAARP
ncbi:MAG: M20 family metallopeptidase [Ectothiorhodospiraceae bacterium]|nr:M20 family metallopeptidase [Ectothiorhodospiraceae bacterium]